MENPTAPHLVKKIIEWVKATYQQLQNQNERPQSRHIAPTLDEIKLAAWPIL